MFDPTEEVIAGLFEELIQAKLDVTVGPRTRKDVTDGSDLRVDFVYEEAQPRPLALEVTSLLTGGVVRIEGFSADLLDTALDNATKLSEARPRQTHLVIRVALNRSREQTLTLVPPDPVQIPELAYIDWIWVVFNTESKGMGDRPWAWWAQPGDTEWNVQIGSL